MAQQRKILTSLNDDELEALEFDWTYWGRKNQLPPAGKWRTWLLLAGRGFGKTRTGAEWVRAQVGNNRSRIALVAPTAADARDVMVEGESGILAISPNWDRPLYEPSKRRVTWPNGAIATTYSADEPERLRGPQHDAAWCDELCLVAGTGVLTVSGERCIEDLRPGDEVWTRVGLRRVVRASRTSVAAEIWELRTPDGRTLRGTANHPIWTAERGFLPLNRLTVGATLLSWDIGSSNGAGRAGISTSAMAITGIATASCSIEKFTSPHMARYRRAWKCTTATRIGRILPWGTWRHYLGRIISDGMRPAALWRGVDNDNRRSVSSNGWSERRAISAAPRVAENSARLASERNSVLLRVGRQIFASAIRAIKRNMPQRQRSKSPIGDQSRAQCVGQHSEQMILERSAVPGRVGSSTAPVVASIRKLNERAPVYNIEVDEAHEYFANGLLTHNCSWRYPEAWDMLLFGLRLGGDPRVVVTTTPKPIKIIRELIADPTTAITRGSTYDNRAYLAPGFLHQIIRKYEGTRLGRQELNAEILDDVPGALWSRAIVEQARWPAHKTVPELTRIVVAIDPAASAGEDADETGIIVAGKDANGRGYVLADASGRYSPTEWARTAISLYRAHNADRIVAEVNNGGDMVEATVRMVDPNVSYTAVRASRGKVIRAEPVAALYEQGRVHHVGALPTLEDQMCAFAPDYDRARAGYSPDRVDALVWALTELLVEPMAGQGIFEWTRQQAEALAAKNTRPPPPTPTLAPGSVEWQKAQEQAGGSQ